MTLLYTIIAFLVTWGLGHILIRLSPLHILISSVWSGWGVESSGIKGLHRKAGPIDEDPIPLLC
jgi:hypothetical protein